MGIMDEINIEDIEKLNTCTHCGEMGEFCGTVCEDCEGNTISEDAAEEMYEDMLNECCTEWETPGGTAAENMRDQDPTMYRCGFNDYIDSLQKDGYIIEGY